MLFRTNDQCESLFASSGSSFSTGATMKLWVFIIAHCLCCNPEPFLVITSQLNMRPTAMTLALKPSQLHLICLAKHLLSPKCRSNNQDHDSIEQNQQDSDLPSPNEHSQPPSPGVAVCTVPSIDDECRFSSSSSTHSQK